MARMFIREMEKANKQKSHQNVVTTTRTTYKVETKIDKNYHIERQIRQSEVMTDKLLAAYNKYNEIIKISGLYNCNFKFDDLKKNYIESKFTYSIAYPVKKDPYLKTPQLQAVPPESWVEKINKSKKEKRLSIINNNKKIIESIEEENLKTIKRVQENYMSSIAEYEKKKECAEFQWNELERRKRKK